MRKYELMCILKTGFDIESSEQAISHIENAIKNNGGIVLNTNKIGRKKLAYDINKNRDAFYVVFDIKMPPNKLIDLKRYLKLNESVIRDYITIQVETKTKVAS